MGKTNTQEQTDTHVKAQLPGEWKVLFHNDEKTTFEFVMLLLMNVFHKSPHDAMEITLLVHESGIGIAGIYNKEIAMEKTDECLKLSRQNGYPLQVTCEEL